MFGEVGGNLMGRCCLVRLDEAVETGLGWGMLGDNGWG